MQNQLVPAAERLADHDPAASAPGTPERSLWALSHSVHFWESAGGSAVGTRLLVATVIPFLAGATAAFIKAADVLQGLSPRAKRHTQRQSSGVSV
jgi:hypothetical protein